jgi:pyruvate dehydrogenase E1 component alpha subunit
MKHNEMMKSLGKEALEGMLRRMLEIRQFEEKIRFLFLEGKMPGTVHQYIGMEACAVGVCTALEEGDVIASTHRPHGHAIARGVSMDSIMGELYGKKTGCCGGKGGSMHVGDLSKGMLPAIAIVGGNLPIVMGMGLAFKIRKEPRVAVSFFGDGASNEGAFHEALNMASVYGVPALFVCENNRYGASTSVKRVMNIEHISDRAAAYGMRGERADGMDVLDVYAHAREAASRAREGEGPTLLELETFRLCGHSRRDPNNYMTGKEKEYWQKRDPIPFFEKLLREGKYMTEKEIADLKEAVVLNVEQAIESGQQSPEPAPEALYEGLYVSMEVPR